MQMSRWTMAVGLVVVVLAFLLFTNVRSRMNALSSDPRDGAAKIALDGADQFHDAVSSGKSNRVCKSIDSSAFQSITGFPCAQFVAYLHGKLGKAVRPKSAQPPLVLTTRVILDQVTQYQRGDAQEHFEYSINGSQAILTNYRIQSEALEH